MHANEVVKALISLGRFRCLVVWKHVTELASQSVCINHFSFCITRMHANTLDVYLCASGVKVLVLQFSKVSAIDCVCPFAAKFLYIEVVCTFTNLLIGVKGHANVTVFHLVMVAQPAHGLHNLGYSSLVVGSKKRGAVGHDEVFAHVVF